jgi:small subunit ribosomal protein S1
MTQTQTAAAAAVDSFAAMFEESLQRANMRSGEVVSAEVVRIDYNFVVVNAGLKSEAYVPIEEFKNDQGEVEVQIGDFVSVAVDAVENGYGDTILSRDKAKRLASWLSLETALESGEFVTGTVSGKVKGGLTVMVNGIRAFLPGSLIDTRPVKDLSPFEGKTMEFKVIKLDRKRNNVVLSRRAVVEASMGEERAKLLETLSEGAIVNGVVKNITEYGAFVDLGGIDGLLHITDMAWRRVRHPTEVVQVGQELTAKVLKFDAEKNRVSLGLKQLGDDPWMGVARRYPNSTRLFGKVTNIADYGAFVEIEPGIEGLVHVSEMDWTNKNVAPAKVVTLGQEVEVMVLEIDEDKRRISLGMKQCRANPWEEFAENNKRGDKVKGPIKSITDFGIFIGLAAGIDGLVHLSDLSWNETGEAAVRNFKKGQEIEAIVLAVDVERERISLGIKQMDSDPFTSFTAVNDRGATVTGKVKSGRPARRRNRPGPRHRDRLTCRPAS